MKINFKGTLMHNCKLCRSPLKKKIEKEILKGASYSVLKRRFEMGRYVVQRHKTQHMTKEVALDMMSRLPALRAPEINYDLAIPSIKDTLGCIEFIHKEQIKMYFDAKEQNDPKFANQILRHNTETLNVAIRAHEILSDMSSQSNWEMMIPKIIAAVKDYPEAKIAISEAMKERKLLLSPDDVLDIKKRG